MLELLTRDGDEIDKIVDIVDIDVSIMGDSELRETYVECRRDIDRREAFAARVLLAIHRRGIPSGDGASSTGAWVQAQTGQRVSDANAMLATAKACASLPSTAKAWAAAEISTSAAGLIGRGPRRGHEDTYVAIEEQLLDRARARDLRGLDLLIGHYQTRADALDDVEPSESNGLYLSRVGNRWKGNSDLDELSGLIHDEALRAATDKPSEGDARTPAKRRADASTAIHRFFLDHGNSPVEGGERPHITIVLRHEETETGAPAFTAETPLAVRDIDTLLCDARISRMILDPNGIPLSATHASYSPPPSLRRAIVIRDRHCRFPGCDRPAGWGQAHHVPHWPEGPTTRDHLALLCGYHHRLVHSPGWRDTFDGITYTVSHDGRLIGSTRAPP